MSSIVLCVVFGLLMLAASAGVWWLGVRTMDGQSYEDIVWSKFDAALPGWLAPVVHVFAISAVVITVSVIMGAIAFAVLIVRKRWLSIAQLAVFGGLCFAAAELLKPLLPRPYLINLESNPNNSAPSGHVILAAAASVMLLCAVPRALRALVAVIGWAYTVLVGLSVIAAQWHRPTDVIMALLIVGGLALLALATTFASGMDGPGTRVSSASVQIVGSVMLTIGVLGILYGAYIIWQIQPGLAMSAEWTNAGAYVSTALLTAAVSALVLGITLAMRQLTRLAVDETGFGGSAARTAEALKTAGSGHAAVHTPHGRFAISPYSVSIIALQTLVIRSGYGYRQQARYCGVSYQGEEDWRILGSGYTVMASVGHIRDLAQPSQVPAAEKTKYGKFGVDIEDGFKPYYIVDGNKKKTVPT